MNKTTLNSAQQPLNGFTYEYNAASQRTKRTEADGSYTLYEYDSPGQVTSGKKYWSDGTLVAGQQNVYSFDDIGNRKTAASGGNEWGTNLRYETYTANALNQYTSRTVPPYLSIIGTATNTATVTVNNQPTYRKGEYWRGELSINNQSSPVYQNVTNLAVLQQGGSNPDLVTNITGTLFLPKALQNFQYDADGNLTNDGQFSFDWDAENRLKKIESSSSTPVEHKRLLDLAYDPSGRRIEKIVSTNNGSYVGQYTNRFLYNDWNLTAKLDGNGTLLESFIWGLDLSGTEQGAGGVGGLLAWIIHTGSNAGVYFYIQDGNGNIAKILRATDGAVMAEYDYDAFGRLIRVTGLLAFENPFRFSTKYTDDETDFVYYGYRFYNPSTGRWLSRDPIEEQGGMNLYGFVGNDGVNYVDPVGLDAASASGGIADMAGRLQKKIDKLSKDDFKRLFLDTQKCILDSLASGKCCLNPKDLEWLNRVVKDFMDPLFDALNGKPNPGWKRSFETVTSYERWGKRSFPLEYEGIDPAWMWQIEAAREMALRHIQQDLRAALQKQGVGRDEEWKCIGNAVTDCEKKFFNGIERIMSKTIGFISNTYNVGELRDDMRDEIKQANGSWTNPYSGLSR